MKKVLSVEMASRSVTQNGQMAMKPTPKPACSNMEEAGIKMVHMCPTVRFYKHDNNHDDEGNESNTYEMLTTTVIMY